MFDISARRFHLRGIWRKRNRQQKLNRPKKKGKLLIIILAVVGVLVIGGGVGAYLLLSKPAAEKHDKHGDEGAEGRRWSTRLSMSS